MFAVNILVQAVVVARRILEQQGRRTRLAGVVTTRQEVVMAPGKTLRLAQRLLPTVCDRCERWVESGAQGGDKVRQRIGEVLVFAAPEAVPRHVDVASEVVVCEIEPGNCGARGSIEKSGRDGKPVGIERGVDGVPVGRGDAPFDLGRTAAS